MAQGPPTRGPERRQTSSQKYIVWLGPEKDVAVQIDPGWAIFGEKHKLAIWSPAHPQSNLQKQKEEEMDQVQEQKQNPEKSNLLQMS